jgi:Family of unknown function (DUF6504)
VTKRYDEPIEVDQDPIDADAPVAFSWRGRRFDIDQRLASWREAGQWWEPTGPARSHNDHAVRNELMEREFFRVLARPSGALASGDVDAEGFMISAGAVYDVYRDRARGGWRLARVWD